jgi:hypothetical protein
LVERLPEVEIHSAVRYLEYLVDRGGLVGKALANAPLDDEELDKDELVELEEALADLASGAVVGHEEARKRLLES